MLQDKRCKLCDEREFWGLGRGLGWWNKNNVRWNERWHSRVSCRNLRPRKKHTLQVSRVWTCHCTNESLSVTSLSCRCYVCKFLLIKWVDAFKSRIQSRERRYLRYLTSEKWNYPGVKHALHSSKLLLRFRQRHCMLGKQKTKQKQTKKRWNDETILRESKLCSFSWPIASRCSVALTT